MHRDANTQLSARWQAKLRAALADKAIVRMHAESKRRATLPDDFEPVCWYSWRNPRSMPDEIVRMRRQAARNFPVPMFQAVWTAHSDEPAWRVRAAWEVLDAVDGGRKIIAPLARFLRVSRKAIRISAKYSARQPSLTCYGRIRRELRLMQAIHAAGLREARLLAEVDLAMRTAHTDLGGACSFVEGCSWRFDDGARIRREAVLAEWRHRIRKLRAKVARESIRVSARLVFHLSSGWTARSLVTAAEVRREGREMGHCVASYSSQVATGDVQVYALQCARNGERMTAVFTTFQDEPWGDGAEPMCTDFGARENGPMSVASLLALVELSQRLGVFELEMFVKTIRIEGRGRDRQVSQAREFWEER